MPSGDEPIGGGAVQAHGETQRGCRVDLPCASSAPRRPAEHVAAACGGQRRPAAGVDVPGAVGMRRGRCPTPLSTTFAARRCESSRAAAIRSFCTSAMSTPSRRAASPGCGVASVGALRVARRGLQQRIRAIRFRASASSATGIGTARARSSIDRAASLVPSPGPRTSASGLGVENHTGVAQHELRHAGVELGRIGHQEAEPHLACTASHRGAPGENQCAAHALGAAQDAERAEGALVHVARGGAPEPRAALAASAGQSRRCPARVGGGIESERVHEISPQWSGPSRGEQARLQRNERRRVRRAHRGRVRRHRCAPSIPLAISSARIGAPLALAHTIKFGEAARRRHD